MSDSSWLRLRDEDTNEVFFVNPKGAWKILAQTESPDGTSIIASIENAETGESCSLTAVKI